MSSSEMPDRVSVESFELTRRYLKYLLSSVGYDFDLLPSGERAVFGTKEAFDKLVREFNLEVQNGR